jgi:hypothetical protein
MALHLHDPAPIQVIGREGGREGGRERREGGREGEREGGREGVYLQWSVTVTITGLRMMGGGDREVCERVR